MTLPCSGFLEGSFSIKPWVYDKIRKLGALWPWSRSLCFKSHQSQYDVFICSAYEPAEIKSLSLGPFLSSGRWWYGSLSWWQPAILTMKAKQGTWEHFHLERGNYIFRLLFKIYYRQISNISHTKSQNLNVPRLVLQLSMPQPIEAMC